MPFLHWETDRRRSKAAGAIRKAKNDKSLSMSEVVEKKLYREPSHTEVSRRTILRQIFLLAAAIAEAMEYDTDERLVLKHLETAAPLHPRRTLDQFYYWTIKDTRIRDRDQVVYRATAPIRDDRHRNCTDKNCDQCNSNLKKIARLVMVDQLWLFILDRNTIITSFPRRWGRNKPDPSAVQKRIRMQLETARENDIQSVFDLALLIVDQCVRTFFDRVRPDDLEPLVFDSFADATGKIKHKQSLAFNYFWQATHTASKAYNSREMEETVDMHKDFLDINPEGKLFLEIQDILDELHIIARVKDQQEKVTKALIKQMAQIYPEFARAKDTLADPESFQVVDWTRQRADHLLESMQNQQLEIENMRLAAEHTSNALKELLSLKQQQASIVEAREAVKQAQETLKQGRSIMLFTIVTIIFLPLSFFSSIFGMNTLELNDSHWTFNEVFSYMFPISIATITVSLLLAFSTTMRAVFSDLSILFNFGILSFIFNVGWTWVITQTPVYTWWYNAYRYIRRLKQEEKKIIAMMKNNAKAKQREMEELKRRIKEAEDKTEEETAKNDGEFDDETDTRKGSLLSTVIRLASMSQPSGKSRV